MQTINFWSFGTISIETWKRETQKLVISGSFSGFNEDDAQIITANELVPEHSTLYHTNAEEADNRMWRHACQSWATRILIYSPDTDTYNIGLGLLNSTAKQFSVQLSVVHSSVRKYVYLNNLQTAFLNDPDLASLPRVELSETLQVESSSLQNVILFHSLKH